MKTMGLFKNKIDIENGKVYNSNDETKEIMNCINGGGYCTGKIEDCYGNVYRGKHEVIYAEANNLPKHLWGDMEINHKNENKQDNRIENLELVTKSYNNTYNDKHAKIGEQLHNRQDLSKVVYKITLDGELVEAYPSASEAARQNGVFVPRIIQCCNGGWFNKKYKKWCNLTVKGYRYSYEHP